MGLVHFTYMYRKNEANEGKIHHMDGQIIATSHEFSPQMVVWWFSKGDPLISEKSRLVKYYHLVRFLDGMGL